MRAARRWERWERWDGGMDGGQPASMHAAPNAGRTSASTHHHHRSDRSMVSCRWHWCMAAARGYEEKDQSVKEMTDLSREKTMLETRCGGERYSSIQLSGDGECEV